jgi:RNA polymerase-binding transcription factor DksA
MELYPLDYQLSLAQTIRAQLRTESSAERVGRLRDALARLQDRRFGECRRCRGVIPFAEILADPAAQTCRVCRQ